VSTTSPAVQRRSQKHAQNIQRIDQMFNDRKDLPQPMTPDGQSQRRELESLVKSDAAAFARWLKRRGGTFLEASTHLNVIPHTLAAWRKSSHKPNTRGRPIQLAGSLTRTDINNTLLNLGPSVGVPSLRLIYPDVTRTELTGHLKTFRRNCDRQRQQELCQLHWYAPGRVWSIDYTELFYPVDERFRWCLAIRDLTTHRQLLALPADHASAEIAFHGLNMLFQQHAPPLVLKADNGSHFTAHKVQQLLQNHHVTPLFSPPYTPTYNGSIEAGIGSLKNLLFQNTLYHGRCDQPTADDLEATRLQLNARPLNPFGDTRSPDQRWLDRTPITDTERKIFLDTLDKCRSELQCEHEAAHSDIFNPPPINTPTNKHRDFPTNAERIAVRQALVALGYLVIQKARFSPPVVA